MQRKKHYPRKARRTVENPNFKHGGYCEVILNAEEKAHYEKRKESFLEKYPYLNEPAMDQMLHQILLIEIQMNRLNAWILSPSIPPEEALGANKRLDALRRTYSLYLTRMGITYVSRERRKERPRRKSPLEMMAESGDDKDE